jgi:PPOX class probable F420-dependent enzyme
VRVTSWQPGWDDIPPALLEFWTERHLCTLATLRADGRPHVVPVGVALDLEQRCAWVITSGPSRKARHVTGDGRVAACQVDGGRWSTIEGTAEVLDDEDSVAEAVRRYAGRYRHPRENPDRVAIRISITSVIGNV